MTARVYRTIRAGHPKTNRAARRWQWDGHLYAIRYYRDDETGETWKTYEIRPPKSEAMIKSQKK